MELGERDKVTGRFTTGHEWNGIKELNTPIPRVVLFFLAIGTLFSIGYWILMPAFPLWHTYSKGLLGIDQRDEVTRQVQEAAQKRLSWENRIASMSYADIQADKDLMRIVSTHGRTLFGDNCAVCHGTRGTGSNGYPNLTMKAWLWGGKPEEIEETIRVGINSGHDKTRVSQMLAFGRDGVLKSSEVNDIAVYVASLADAQIKIAGTNLEAARKLYQTNCANCHGDNGKGSANVGAPDLTDRYWIYGGDLQSIVNSIYYGRQGHMPHWESRLNNAERKILTLYVLGLGEKKP